MLGGLARLRRRRASGRELKERLVEQVGTIKMGDVGDFSNFMGAVIDEAGLRQATRRDRGARDATTREVVAGGECDDREGYFVEPTLIETEDPRVPPHARGVLRPDRDALRLPGRASGARRSSCVDRTSPYALTGAIFAHDRAAIAEATTALRDAAGNFYINDKPTGAVVGQQPFGGARASGTDDKAGSPLNLLRWVVAADDQGDVRAADRLPVSVPGRRQRRTARRPRRQPLKRAFVLASALVLVAASVATAARVRGTRKPDRLQTVNAVHDVVTCGGGYDLATVDGFDRVGQDCETVTRRTSLDPYRNPVSEHATEVEPDSAAFGTTVVAVFQVGRYFDGGSHNIGFAVSRNSGLTWRHGFLHGLTPRVSDPSIAYDRQARAPGSRSRSSSAPAARSSPSTARPTRSTGARR